METVIWLIETIALLILMVFSITFTHQATKNSWFKLPIFIFLSIPISALMVWLGYIPFLLLIALLGINYYMLQGFQESKFLGKVDYVPNKLLFAISSYLFIVITSFLAWSLQSYVRVDDQMVPVWKALFTSLS